MTEQMPGELIYGPLSDSDLARLLKRPPPSASDGGVIGDGDLRADRGMNRLARQAMFGERAGHRRSNPSI